MCGISLCLIVCVIIMWTEGQGIICMFNFNSIVESMSQFVVFIFDCNNLIVDFYVNVGRNNDWCFSNMRYFFF